jgi:hypothetical protein
LLETGVAVWHKAVAHSSNARAQNDNFTLTLYARFLANPKIVDVTKIVDVIRRYHKVALSLRPSVRGGVDECNGDFSTVMLTQGVG